MEDNNEEEITIDFSKIKNLFKKKTEKDKVDSIEKETDSVKKEIDREIKEDNHNPKLEEDKEKVEKIEKELEKEEKEAIIIDGEKKLVDNKLEDEKKELSKIKDDLKEDEEVSFDFSKVKNFFKNIKEKSKNEKQKTSEEEVSFDFNKAVSLVKKYHIVLLILIPLILSLYLRVTPGYLPVTDDWARNSVESGIKQQISAEIISKYPNLPQANINSLIEDQFQQIKKEGKSQIDEQVVQASTYFKSRLQKDGQTYLIAIDPYFWMGHARNILEKGHAGDELRNPKTKELCDKMGRDCVPWDSHMFAPLGRAVPPDMFHAYFEAYFHKVMSIFNPNQDIMSSAFIIPALLASLCVIPAFFIAKKIAGNFGGIVAAIMVAIHPAFLTRTVAGFADTDAYNVLFPLFITWLFLEAFETQSWKKSSILSMLAGFLVFVYLTSWGGWWYIFNFLLISVVMYIGIQILIKRDKMKKVLKEKEIRHSVFVLGIFFFSALLFSALTPYLYRFWGAFRDPISFIKLKEVGINTVWPNVFTTVAEQNTASLNSVIGQIGTGSILLFSLAILGIAMTLTKKNSKDKKDLYYLIVSAVWILGVITTAMNSGSQMNLIVFLVLISLPIVGRLLLEIYNKNKDIDFKLAIILIIWFTSTMYASTKGVRFLLLLVPAFSIGLGVAFGLIYKYVSKLISKGLYLNEIIAKGVVMLLLLLLLISPMRAATSTVKNEIPSMNDAWYNSLDKINQEAEPDAIINSWWDFGHWFKYIGDRAVTFDGTSQNTPMAHWIGYSLLTNDEKDAMGVLRMLDCGSNTAFDKLDEKLNDTAKSVSILHEVVKLNKEDARDYLLDYVNADKAEEVLEYTHCVPPENYYITSDDMIGKSGVWSHFGIWNFNKALIYNTLKRPVYEKDKSKSIDFLKERFDYTDDEAEGLYYEVKGIRNSEQANSWIAPWPSYASGISSCGKEGKDIICPLEMRGSNTRLNVRINLENKEAEISAPGQTLYPNAIVFPTKNGIDKMEFDNNTIGYSMALIPNGDQWNYVMMLPPLEDSMFTRLFYLDGHGLTNFKKFSDERSVIGNRIIVWKVDWEGTERNEVYFAEEETELELVENLDETDVVEEIDNSDEEELDEGAIEDNLSSENDEQDVNN